MVDAIANYGCLHLAAQIKDYAMPQNEAMLLACTSLPDHRLWGTGLANLAVRPWQFACLACGSGASSCMSTASHHQQCGHAVFVDIARLQLYCCICLDYIYDEAFDAAMSASRCMSTVYPRGNLGDMCIDELQRPRLQAPLPRLSPAKRRQSAPRDESTPEEYPDIQPMSHPADGLPLGLRGINNLGNTCFMNSVLQALLHAPELRRFFLESRHSHRRLCAREASDSATCLSCELESLFSEAYGGCRTPVSPVAFLHAWWLSAGGHLEGYQQQDSHEFYLSALSCLTASLATPCASEDASDITSLSHQLLPSATMDHHHWPDIGSDQEVTSPPSDLSAFQDTDEESLAMVSSRSGTTSPLHQPGMQSLSGTLNPITQELTRQLSKLHEQQALGQQSGSCLSSLCDDVLSQSPAQSAMSLASTLASDEGQGDGIMQRVFGGLLRSDVVCGGCGYTSTAFDPFLDLSLDLPPNLPPPKVWQRAPARKGQNSAAAGQGVNSTATPPSASTSLLASEIVDSARQDLHVAGEREGSSEAAPTASSAGRRQSIDAHSVSPRESGASSANTSRPEDRERSATVESAAVTAPENTSDRMMSSPNPDLECGGGSGGHLSECRSDLDSPLMAPVGDPAATAESAPTGGSAGEVITKEVAAAAQGGATLFGCLQRFVSREHLGRRDHWQCSRCRACHQAVKQMSIAHLPQVLALHIKRFEAGNGLTQQFRKLTTPLTFPVRQPLDMAPFLSSSVLTQRHGFRAAPTSGSVPEGVHGSKEHLYEAYAIVCHHGGMAGGHYTTYLRGEKDEWFLCDDSWIGSCETSAVENAQAFQLFYKRVDVNT